MPLYRYIACIYVDVAALPYVMVAFVALSASKFEKLIIQAFHKTIIVLTCNTFIAIAIYVAVTATPCHHGCSSWSFCFICKAAVVLLC